jgi:hypothetical protein
MLKGYFDKNELIDLTGFDIVKFFENLTETSLKRLAQRMLQAQLINYSMLRKVGDLMEDGIPKIRESLTSGQKEKFLDAASGGAKDPEADAKWTYIVLYTLTSNLKKFVEMDPEASKLIPELIEIKKIVIRYWESFFRVKDFASYVELIEQKGVTNEVFYGIPLRISALSLVNQDLGLRNQIVSEEVSETHYQLLVEEMKYVSDKVTRPLELKAQAHIAELFLDKMWQRSDFKDMTPSETLNYLLNRVDQKVTDWVIHYVNPLEIAILVKAIRAFTRLRGKIEKSCHFILSSLINDYVTGRVKVKDIRMSNIERKRAKESAAKINRQLYLTEFAFNGELKE